MPAAANTTASAAPPDGGLKRKRSVKKKKKNMDLLESPLKRQLKEVETWTRPAMDEFEDLATARERVQVSLAS